ncbi:putative RNA helicase [Ceratobasidium sp. 423]|nr:putative RNA helicase [Ceratobasidium sp. 423]
MSTLSDERRLKRKRLSEGSEDESDEFSSHGSSSENSDSDADLNSTTRNAKLPVNDDLSESEDEAPKLQFNFDTIPNRITKTTRTQLTRQPTVSKDVTFASLGVKPWLVASLDAMSIRKPTPVQIGCLPSIISGRDCIGNAKTGSGKTMAFAIPILQKLSEDPYGIYALVLTPTRELAFQISEQFVVLGGSLNLRTAVIVGGMDMMEQALELGRRPHVVVATPGRLVDHMDSNGDEWSLSRLKFLLHPSVETVGTLKQHYLLVPSHVREPYLFYALCNPPESIAHMRVAAPEHQKPSRKPKKVNRAFRPPKIDEDAVKQPPPTIVFVSKPRTAAYLAKLLQTLGIRATALHSRLKQRERLNSLNLFRSRVVPVLISTDVGARGLDIADVALVVNWDFPSAPEEYTHRVGRTARAGRNGMAISFVTERDEEKIHRVEARIGTSLTELSLPEDKVLEGLNAVSTAKRIANMELHDSEFGKREEIHAKKAAKLAK